MRYRRLREILGLSGGGGLLKTERTLVHSEILTLPTTPVEIVPGVEGKTLIAVSGYAALNLIEPYSGVLGEIVLSNGAGISNPNDIGYPGGWMLEDVTLPGHIIFPSMVLADQLEATGIAIRVRLTEGGGNLTGGHADNTLKVTVFYVEVGA